MAKLSLEQEQTRIAAMSQYEDKLWHNGIIHIAGIDEAGRGPLAGPVTAAAVILPQDCFIAGINDSKKLSAKKRQDLEIIIKEKALAWSCVHVNQRIIDKINILEASKLGHA